MPRLIDHDVREREIAEAAWRVISREGLPGLSVRKVADEAGLATASLRRSFPTQEALRVACLRLVTVRVQERIDRLDPRLPARELVEAGLAEVLPLDAERALELHVQVAVGTLARTEPGVAEVETYAHDLLRQACRSMLVYLAASDPRFEQATQDLDATAATLHALLDGLALHLLRERAGADGEQMRAAGAATVALLSSYLDSLATGP